MNDLAVVLVDRKASSYKNPITGALIKARGVVEDYANLTRELMRDEEHQKALWVYHEIQSVLKGNTEDAS